MTSHREIVTAKGAPAAVGPYSHAVRCGDVLFCSGQIPLDPDTASFATGGIGPETRQCLDNLAAVCASAGTELRNAVRLTVYATSLADDWQSINEAYGSYFEGGDAPARVAIGVAALPMGARVEIDAVVAIAR
jgi:2-iminobutanoate/2-iminopropanoate deaminase